MERQEIIDLKLIRDKYFKNHPSYQKAINIGIDAIQQIQKDEDCIARNKELESSLEKYEKIIKDNTIIVKDESGDYQELNINIADYISKTKIKEKIAELNKKNIDNFTDTNKLKRIFAIDILQELLNKGE